MAVPAQSLRLVSVGSLPSGETFNTGLWVLSDVPISTYEDLVLSMAVPQVAFNSFWDSMGAYFSPQVHLNELRGYYYDGGESGDHATLSAVVPLDANPGGNTGVFPPQVAVVASLRTGRAGRSYRGRMYLPLNAIGVDLNGQLIDAQCTDIANQVATLISSINAGVGPVVIVSALQSTAINVTSVQVNSVLDTQRRRTNKMKPLWNETVNVSS